MKCVYMHSGIEDLRSVPFSLHLHWSAAYLLVLVAFSVVSYFIWISRENDSLL